MEFRIALVFLFWAGLGRVEGIWLNVPAVGTKCMSEEIIQDNAVVIASYGVVSEDPNITLTSVSVKVTSPYGNILHQNESVPHGEFAFTTKEVGDYQVCFWLEGNHNSKGASVNLEWNVGITAKDWDSVAKREKLEGVELELKKLHELVDDIYWNLLYLKGREEDMTTVSEKTNKHVTWFSFMSLLVCMGASVFQLLYLKRYFYKKKLI